MIPFKDSIPSRRFPFMTVTLIIINVAVFIYELSLPWEELDDLISTYGVVPSKLQLVAHDPVRVLGEMAGSLATTTLLHAVTNLRPPEEFALGEFNAWREEMLRLIGDVELRRTLRGAMSPDEGQRPSARVFC